MTSSARCARQTGNRSQYAAPGNIYATNDGKWASIAASTQSIFERFCRALELEHLSPIRASSTIRRG